MLLFRLSGVLLLRFAARRLIGLLFHDPPRRTIARPRITVSRDRWCHDSAADVTLPAADQPPQLVHEPGGMFVLIHRKEPQLAREPQLSTQQRELAIRLGESVSRRRPRTVQRAVEREGRILDLSREDEALLPGELRRRG